MFLRLKINEMKELKLTIAKNYVKGYNSENQEEVIPLCTTCHHKKHKKNGV